MKCVMHFYAGCANGCDVAPRHNVTSRRDVMPANMVIF